jgi:hypothetical protein
MITRSLTFCIISIGGAKNKSNGRRCKQSIERMYIQYKADYAHEQKTRDQCHTEDTTYQYTAALIGLYCRGQI